jgi:hypothetical protein
MYRKDAGCGGGGHQVPSHGVLFYNCVTVPSRGPGQKCESQRSQLCERCDNCLVPRGCCQWHVTLTCGCAMVLAAMQTYAK